MLTNRAAIDAAVVMGFPRSEVELWVDILDDCVQYGDSTMRCYNVTMRCMRDMDIPGHMTLIEALLDDGIFHALRTFRTVGPKTEAHLIRARTKLIDKCKKEGTVEVPCILDLAGKEPELFQKFVTLYKFLGWNYSGDRIHYATTRRRIKNENVS